MKMKNLIRVSTFIAAVWLMCYGHDTQQMILWGIGGIYVAFFMWAQLWPVKKPRGGNHETKKVKTCDSNHSIDFEETQLK